MQKTTVPRLDVTEKPLTSKEAKDMGDPLKIMLRTVFMYSDVGLASVKKQPVQIWSTITDDEIDIIADVLLTRAQESQRVANMVRKVSHDYKKMQLGIILVPRAVQTVRLMVTSFLQGGTEHADTDTNTTGDLSI